MSTRRLGDHRNSPTREEPSLDSPCGCGHTFGYHCTPEFPNGGYCAATDTASPVYGCSCTAFYPLAAVQPLRRITHENIERSVRGAMEAARTSNPDTQVDAAIGVLIAVVGDLAVHVRAAGGEQ